MRVLLAPLALAAWIMDIASIFTQMGDARSSMVLTVMCLSKEFCNS